MTATTTTGRAGTAGGVWHWVCRCCGYRLGVLIGGELRPLAARVVRQGQSAAVRCPSCRSRERLDLAVPGAVQTGPCLVGLS